MNTDLEVRLSALRNERSRLLEKRQKMYDGLREYIKERLHVFRCVLRAESYHVDSAEQISDSVTFVLNDRLDKIESHCLDQAYSVFKVLMVPRAEMDAFLGGRRRERDERCCAANLDNLLKMAYCIGVLRQEIDRALTDADSLYISVNIVSVTCKFFNGSEDLSVLGPLCIEWPYSAEYSDMFSKDFRVPFDVEKMKEFLVEKKVAFLSQDLHDVVSLNTMDMEALLSCRFEQTHTECEILREGEVSGRKVTGAIKAVVGKLNTELDLGCTNERLKALKFSYVALKYKGLARYFDTQRFKTSAAYYYVYWIDHYQQRV